MHANRLHQDWVIPNPIPTALIFTNAHDNLTLTLQITLEYAWLKRQVMFQE